MKRCIYLASAVMLFGACTEELAENIYPDPAPLRQDKIEVCIEDGVASKVQLDENSSIVWNKGDLVRISDPDNKSAMYEFWRFDGETGDKKGTLSFVSQEGDYRYKSLYVAVYPASESISTSTLDINGLEIPKIQTYQKNSYKISTNRMIALRPENGPSTLEFQHGMKNAANLHWVRVVNI